MNAGRIGSFNEYEAFSENRLTAVPADTDLETAVHSGRRVSGSHGGKAGPAQDMPRPLALCRTGKLAYRDPITERVVLDEINGALARTRDGTSHGPRLIRVKVRGDPDAE